MMTITQKIDMDLKKRTVVPGINAVQGDAYTRQVEICLLDDGQPWQIPAGVGMLVRYIRSDGTGGEYDSLPQGEAARIIGGNVISLTLAPQMLTATGMVQVNVTLIRDAQRLSTFCFMVNVHPGAGAMLESSEGYYHVSGFLPMPETAQPGQFIRVREVDGDGIARKVEAVSAEDAEIWVPRARSVDLTGLPGDVCRRAIMLDEPLDLEGWDTRRIRKLAVQAAPGAAVRFALYYYNKEEGLLIWRETIGDAVADPDSGLAVWADEAGHWIFEADMVVLALAESAVIRCYPVPSGLVVSGQMKFEDGNYYDSAEGTRIPCAVVTEETAQPGDIWYALFAMEADGMSRKTVDQYLRDNGRELEALDKRIDGVLPAITFLDNGKVLTVAAGEYVLAAPADGGLPPVTAADEGKVMKVVDGEWAPGEAGDGIRTETVLEEQTISGFAPLDGLYGVRISPAPFSMTVGAVYRVIWDGTTYLCRAQDASVAEPGAVGMGNGSVWGLESGGEPFIIARVGNAMLIYGINAVSTHTVGVYRDDLGLTGDYIRVCVNSCIQDALGGEY